ncbi:MAG: hypothetical protein L6R00_04765 [Phycisphaerae bacterium]|nr:hypothetical protein [Phycisphaerae bacterium]
MNPSDVAPDDPLIEEVRQRRRDLFDACGRDWDKFFKRIERTQNEHPEKVCDRRKRRSKAAAR